MLLQVPLTLVFKKMGRQIFDTSGAIGGKANHVEYVNLDYSKLAYDKQTTHDRHLENYPLESYIMS